MMMATALFSQSPFVKVKDGKFWRNNTPYYYVGTNFWYGAILGSEGQGGDRKRLCAELDALKKAGIDNLRILVGSDGERGVTTKVEPTLQVAPGVYNDTILAGLDFLLMEMGKRNMLAVLYLNNSWEWSGGYGFYLEHAGMGKAPRPNEAGYTAYMDFVSKYATCEKAHKLFYDYVRFILSRTNSYTGEGDYGFYEEICKDRNISYCNIHLWPYNWSWARPDHLIEDLPKACDNTREYIDKHLAICQRLGKPLVMEEFGYPRDGFSFSTESTTQGRDGYYKYVFSLVADNAERGGLFAGCNFWGWGGFAKPKHEQWQVGDDYTGDPAQEAQGLNSVFSTDISTLAIIAGQVERMRQASNRVK